MTTTTETWETIASNYRSQTTAKIPIEWLLPSSITSSISETSFQNVLDIPRTCGILSQEEIEITEMYDAVTLSGLLGEGKVKSVDVTRAFCKRAAVAQQLVSYSFIRLYYGCWDKRDIRIRTKEAIDILSHGNTI